MFHGIDHTDPTRVSVLLPPDRKGPTQVAELIGEHMPQPYPQLFSENPHILFRTSTIRV
jgi:hypothetical protein